MVHLNMDVNIDVVADNVWGSSASWIKTQVMRKIEVAMLELSEYPIKASATLEGITADATLEDYNIMTESEE